MENKYTQKLNRKVILVGLAIVLAVFIVAGYAYKHQSKKPTVIETPSGVINLNPPTEQDKQAVEEHKDELVKQQGEPSQQPSSGKKDVAPIIVDASQYEQAVEVRAFEPGVTESGAACDITFSLGATSFTKRADATADATITRCTNLKVPRSEFNSAGSWKVVVTYSSATTNGSATRLVEVK